MVTSGSSGIPGDRHTWRPVHFANLKPTDSAKHMTSTTTATHTKWGNCALEHSQGHPSPESLFAFQDHFPSFHAKHLDLKVGFVWICSFCVVLGACKKRFQSGQTVRPFPCVWATVGQTAGQTLPHLSRRSSTEWGGIHGEVPGLTRIQRNM